MQIGAPQPDLKIKQQRPSPPNIEQNKQNLQCPTKQLTFPSVSSLSYKIFTNFSLVGQKKLLLKKTISTNFVIFVLQPQERLFKDSNRWVSQSLSSPLSPSLSSFIPTTTLCRAPVAYNFLQQVVAPFS